MARYQVVCSWAASAVSTSSSAVAASQSAASTRGSVTAPSSAGRSAGAAGERRASARRRAERDAGGGGTRPYTRGPRGGKSTLAWRCGDATKSLVAVAFSPLVARWFEERFGTPTPAQAAGWPAIARGADTLIAAPTRSGKTLAAFLWSLDRLLRAAGTGGLEERTDVVYVLPLKALGNDVQRNLARPLAEIDRKSTRLNSSH